MKNKDILKRYEKDKKGQYIIAIKVNSFKDLYDRFDLAPFSKRDLNEDFIDFLIDSVEELKNHNFIIKIKLPKKEKSKTFEKKIQNSIYNYFNYLIEKEKKEFKTNLQITLFKFVFASLLILITTYVSERVNKSSLYLNALLEGLYIVAWVAMWPVFDTILYNWTPYLRNKKVYRKILNSIVKIEYF